MWHVAFYSHGAYVAGLEVSVKDIDVYIVNTFGMHLLAADWITRKYADDSEKIFAYKDPA